MAEHREIDSLSGDVLANLTIEELEQRLEMQAVRVPGAEECTWSCSSECSSVCSSVCEGVNCSGVTTCSGVISQ